MKPPASVEYCKKCNAPHDPVMAVFMRCGPCSVVNGKLPPTRFIAIKVKS